MSENGHDDFFYWIMLMSGASLPGMVHSPFCDYSFSVDSAESRGEHVYRCPSCGKDVKDG